MFHMIDENQIDDVKARIADRYTSAELIDLLDVNVEALIEEYWHLVIQSTVILEEVGSIELKEEDNDLS